MITKQPSRKKDAVRVTFARSVPRDFSGDAVYLCGDWNAWQTTHVAEVMTEVALVIPFERLVSARLDEDLAKVLEEMARVDVNQMPVVDDGKFLGLVTRGNILAFLRSMANLQARGAPV